jgi:hypothetical protein
MLKKKTAEGIELLQMLATNGIGAMVVLKDVMNPEFISGDSSLSDYIGQFLIISAILVKNFLAARRMDKMRDSGAAG